MESKNDSHLCRLCLQDEQYLIYIFQEHPVQMYVPADVIQELLQIQVSETDGYPPFACLGCFDKLSDIRQFKNQCLGSIKAYENLLTLKASCESEPREMQGPSAVMKQELEDETNECESNEGPSAVMKQELEDETNEYESNEEMSPPFPLNLIHTSSGQEMYSEVPQPTVKEESEEETNEDYSNDDPLVIVKQESIGSEDEEEYNEIEEADLRVWTGEEIPKKEMCKPYQDSNAPRPVENKYEEPRINIPDYHVGTRASGKWAVKDYRDNETPSNKGRSAQEKKKDKCRESATLPVSTKCAESHRKRAHFAVEGAVDADSHTRNNRSDKSSPKRPKCVSSLEETSLVRIEKSKSSGLVRQNRCEICDKTFANKAVLNTHARVHTGEKPFKCSVCSMHFATGNTRNKHMRTHTGEKPYKCNECTAHFSQKVHLTAHMRTHTGEKPYKCDTCCKTFTRSSTLKLHELIHTQKHYQCFKCSKQYIDESYLNCHLERCTEGKLGSKE